MTIYFVYAHGDRISTTHAITREIVARLQRTYDVHVHDPNRMITIKPNPGDILIGHPNRYAACTFRLSFDEAGWHRRIVFAPFSHGILHDAAAIDDLVVAADSYLAITGPEWFDTVANTAVSHWQHRMLRCDLGVNRAHFPKISRTFAPTGKRRFLYIGNADAMKGGDFLAALASANPDLVIDWIMTGDQRHCLDRTEELTAAKIRRVMMQAPMRRYAVNFYESEGLAVVANYDFIISCGRSDAMPGEVLEAASWGLVPVTTPQCGFPADEWMTHIPLDDVPAASAILKSLNDMSADQLVARQLAGFAQLRDRFHWDRVADQVIGAINAPQCADPTDREWLDRRNANQRKLRALICRRDRGYAIAGARNKGVQFVRRVQNRGKKLVKSLLNGQYDR